MLKRSTTPKSPPLAGIAAVGITVLMIVGFAGVSSIDAGGVPGAGETPPIDASGAPGAGGAMPDYAGGALAGEAAGNEPRRPWPMRVPIHLSSSFGEFRTGHLHAGVDIRTFGREGVPCHAVGDGWVSRLRTSPFGYGKAVYLTLGSGETVVYAHLAEFSPVLDSVICQAQLSAGRYRVDIYRDPGELPVREGEIIGYTGRTGTAAPHLHFEVRDGDQNPINPLSNGWELEDGEYPRIHGVGWVPLTPSSRVNDWCYPAIGELDEVSAQRYAAKDTVRIDGRVGVSVRIIDRLDDSSGRLAPFRVELRVDGILTTEIELQRFSYSHTGEVELAYNMERARAAGRHYLFLFRREGETLWNRSFRNDGVIDAGSLDADRVHTAEIRAIDRGGNVTVAQLPFTVGGFGGAVVDRDGARADGGDAAPMPPSTSVPEPLVHVSDTELPGCFFLGDLLSVHGGVIGGGTLPPRAKADDARGEISATANLPDSIDRVPGSAAGVPGSAAGVPDSVSGVPGSVAGVPGSAAAIDEAAATDGWVVTTREVSGPWSFDIAYKGMQRSVRMYPVGEGEVVSGSLPLGPDLDVHFVTRDESFYADAFVYLTTWEGLIEKTTYPKDELTPVTAAARLGPLALVCKGSIKIAFTLDHEGDGREAVYRLRPRKEVWSFVSSFVKADTVSAYIGSPGVYAVFSDTVAPRISPAQVAIRTSYATGGSEQELVIPIVDEGCGLDYENTEVYIDGTKQIARWDGFLQKMFILLANKNIIGEHDLRVVAVDRVGNTSQDDSKFHVPTVTPRGDSAPTDASTD